MSIPLLNSSRIIPLTHRRTTYHIIFLAMWIFTLYTGAIGTDFLTHWDEHKLFKSIRESIPVGNVIPGWYNYPSMIYDLTVLSESPEILTLYLSDRSTYRDNMEKQLRGDELRKLTLRARMMFLGITSLSIVWTYLLVYVWTKQWPQALVSSAILASSWELEYHARWIAPDAILMQFGILTILLVFVALRSIGRRKYMWLIAAAVSAGLACGTKYFGGIFLVPVFLGAYQALRDANAKRNSYFALFIGMLMIFVLTLLLITPGILMDTGRMIVDVRYEIGHYQTGDTGYTVNAGWQHLSLLFVYLFGVFFSKYLWISLPFSLMVLIGFYTLVKGNWKSTETWVFLSVPLFFILYVSQQRVMMVRNDLLLFPFLAILSARGLVVLWNSRFFQSNRMARAILAAGLICALLINFNWLYVAGKSISRKLTIDWSVKLPSYLLAHKQITYYLTSRVRNQVDTQGLPNVVSDPLLADKLVFVFEDVDHPLANRPNIYDPIYGSYEVNLDYYPSWHDDDRIVVMPMKAALPQKQFEFIYK